MRGRPNALGPVWCQAHTGRLPVQAHHDGSAQAHQARLPEHVYGDDAEMARIDEVALLLGEDHGRYLAEAELEAFGRSLIQLQEVR